MFLPSSEVGVVKCGSHGKVLIMWLYNNSAVGTQFFLYDTSMSGNRLMQKKEENF